MFEVGLEKRRLRQLDIPPVHVDGEVAKPVVDPLPRLNAAIPIL
jgi:hypothetical protein